MSRHAPSPSPTAASAEDALLLAVGHALPLPCVVALPADGRVLFANHALGALLAVEAHYLVGDRLDRLFLDETRASELRAMMMAGPLPPQLPVTLRRQSRQGGQPVKVSMCAASVSLGADTLAVLFFLPLTAQTGAALPTALLALRQGLSHRSEIETCLERLREALTRSP